MPDNAERRPPKGAAPTNQPRSAHHYIAGLRRRRAATYRLPADDCSHADPWTCKCHNSTDNTTDQYIDGYRDAARHLLAQGLTPAPNLPAMRGMWKRGGDDQRLAMRIAQLWEVAA
jgi:hypothetical protein